MFCVNCGRELGEEDSFCTECGCPVEKEKTEIISNVKGSRKKFLILIPILALAVGIIAISGTDFFKRTFYSPEKYFQYTMKKYVQEESQMLAEWYGRLVKGDIDISDSSVSGELTVRFGEEGIELLESAAAFGDLDYLDDLAWLEQVSVATEFSVKDEIISGNLALKLGEDELLSANSIADMADETAYLQIPVLSDKYACVDLDEYLDELSYYMEDGDIIGYFETLYACYPEKEEVERLLYKYGTLALSGIEDVEKSRETLHAGDVDQKCTALRTVIKSRTLRDISKAVLKEMKNDEELRRIMKNLSDLEGFDYLYDEYRNLLDEALDDAEDIDLYDDIVLTIYTDNKGSIIGMQVKMGDDRFCCVGLQKGKNIGYEVVCDADGVGFLLEGEGEESGGLINADFVLETDSYYGSEEVEFRVENFDKKAVRKGNVSGTVIFALEELEDMLGIDGRFLRGYVLTVTFDMDEQSRNADIRLMDDEEEVVSVGWNMKIDDGKEVSIPKKSDVIMIEDERDVSDWLDSVDTDRLIDHLKETALPRDIVYELEDILDWYM